MPTYTFRRPDGALVSRKLTFDEYELVRSECFQAVDDDGSKLEFVFNPGSVGFILKDGPSGGWMSKANKENGYRQQRGAVMAERERNHVFKTKLIPNYQGQEAASWKDVRDEVRHAKGEAAARTYDGHVKAETV